MDVVRGIPRLESRNDISMYSAESTQNDQLIKLALLDFHILQAQHKDELQHVIEWWKKLDSMIKVSYAKDRAVESYFWPLCVYYEPQYVIGRTKVDKLVAVTCAVDDINDVYGTLEELTSYYDTRLVIAWISNVPRIVNSQGTTLVNQIIHLYMTW